MSLLGVGHTATRPRGCIPLLPLNVLKNLFFFHYCLRIIPISRCTNPDEIGLDLCIQTGFVWMCTHPNFTNEFFNNIYYFMSLTLRHSHSTLLFIIVCELYLSPGGQIQTRLVWIYASGRDSSGCAHIQTVTKVSFSKTFTTSSLSL